jgi:hypothetical protein
MQVWRTVEGQQTLHEHIKVPVGGVVMLLMTE